MLKNVQPHIQLPSNLNIRYALLPGDPARVDRVRPFLENPQELTFNREYKSIYGSYKGKNILVLSTGMGGPSTGIAVEELANIGVTTLVRIGSCGALQEPLQLGDLIIATGAVRDEGTTKAYIESGFPAIADIELVTGLQNAARKEEVPYHCGIIRSHDSFYTDKEAAIDLYWSQKGVLAADMETAALFVVGALRGLKTASLLNVVVTSEGDLKEGVNDYASGEKIVAAGEKRQILVALEAIASIQHK